MRGRLRALGRGKAQETQPSVSQARQPSLRPRSSAAAESVLLDKLDEEPPRVCLEHEDLGWRFQHRLGREHSDRGLDGLGIARLGAAAPRRAHANRPDRRRGTPGAQGGVLTSAFTLALSA